MQVNEDDDQQEKITANKDFVRKPTGGSGKPASQQIQVKEIEYADDGFDDDE